jgi:uncharacterized protein (DUF362 family)
MKPAIVSIVRYKKPLASVRKAIDLCGGFDHLPAGARVFIKPNIVFWTRFVPFPKWGVITTSRVVEDTVVLLKERGIDDITIGEGTVTRQPKDFETPAHAFESLGYGALAKRYGVRVVNIFERPFKKIDLGGGAALSFNVDFLESDFLVNLPVLKTHAQAVVSLGIKNLKGLIDVPSRKKCHNASPGKDLNFYVSRLARPIPPALTILDGIYTNERGPGFDGKIHRSNILIASRDILSADMVGAGVLGYEPSRVPHLEYAARDRGRPLDLSDIEVKGESIASVASHHEYTFPYNDSGSLPLPMVKIGIQGLSYKKYDLTMCTYCSGLTRVILMAIARAWKGTPWDEVEILTGKAMKPTPGMKKTLLLGKCMVQANKDHPDIREMIPIKGCPPSRKELIAALLQAGIEIDPSFIENLELAPGVYMKRYEGKPEFEESFFTVFN